MKYACNASNNNVNVSNVAMHINEIMCNIKY